MIWHIFKKDWKLLWLFVVVVALLDWMSEAIVYKLGLFGGDSMLEMLAEQLPVVVLFAGAFLVVAIVHLDALPGTRQDWLVRPVARRDLLLEKLLFTIIAVLGPVFLANLFVGLADGFSLRASFDTALWRAAFLLVVMVLPIFILASATQNMTQAFIFGCGCAFIISIFVTFGQYWNDAAHGTLTPVLHSGVGWVAEVFRFAVVVVAAGVIVSLQYFRRETGTSRALGLGFGFILLFSTLFPWSIAFGIERHLSSDPSAGDVVKVTFDPQAGKYRSPSGVSDSASRRSSEGAQVVLPLRITGIEGDETPLTTDRVEVRLIANGGVVYHGNSEGAERSDKHSYYQQIEVPDSIYNANQNRPLSVQMDFSLTIFRLAKSYAIRALNGDERMPGWGWCETRMNDSGTALEMRCIEPGRGPICGSASLENTSTGARNPQRFACWSDYTPFADRGVDDGYTRFGVNIPFRDPSGLAKYPVDGPQLKQSQVVVRMYEPVDHFTRSLVIPQIKLRDWVAQ